MGSTCSSRRTDKVAPVPASVTVPSMPDEKGPDSMAASGAPSQQRTPTQPQIPLVDTLSARALLIPKSDKLASTNNKRRRASAARQPQLPPALATVGKGVSLRGLRKLRSAIRKHFGEERYDSVSTTEVCHQWVKVVTAPAGKCRLVELPGLLDPTEGDVGRPMYFISHAWSNSIELLFRKVFDFLASADDGTRVWLDVLAVCQHESNPAHRADIAAFADVVAACSGGTLVVMDLTRCNPATRAWCVFEWAHTLANHGPDGLHMSLAPLERAAVFADLDVERAECFRPADKDMIMREVRRQHGSPEAFNAKLKLQLLLEPLSYSVDLRRLQERSRDTAWDFTKVDQWLEHMYGGTGGGGGRAGGGRRSGTSPGGASGACRALCVVSGAGEGKSTISAELVRKLTPASASTSTAAMGPGGGGFAQRTQIACAYHFLKYNDQRRLDPVRIIKTMAFQLASRIPSVYSGLMDCDVAEVAQITDVDRAFETLLLRPLQGVTNPVVIVLDALDEAEPVPFATPAAAGDGVGGGISSVSTYPVLCGNRALQLLTKHLQRLPLAVRFFVTTRPDAASGQVVSSLERTFQHQGGSIYLKPSQLVRSLALRASADGGGGPAAVAAGSGGGVMVYHTVVKACLSDGQDNEYDGKGAATADNTPDGGSKSRRPGAAGGGGGGGGPLLLASLLGGMTRGSTAAAAALASQADLTALYSVYGKVFRKAYDCYDLRKRTDVSNLLNVLLAAQEPLSQSLVQQLGLGHAVPLLPGFPVLFYVDEHHLFTLHKSLADWLLLDATTAKGPSLGPQGGNNPLDAALASNRSISVTSTTTSTAVISHPIGSRSLFFRPYGNGGGESVVFRPTTASGSGGGGSLVRSSGLFSLTRSTPGQASRAAIDSEATRAAARQAAAVAAANAPSPSFRMDLAQGHLILGRYLSTTRNASPSTYCLKYLVTHLAAAGPAAAELLDDVLASFNFIEAVFARGYSANVIRALGTMVHSSRLSRDALRWLRAKQHDLLLAASSRTIGTGDAVVGTALMSPLASELYRVALRVANQGWRTRVVIPPYDDWPADQAVLKGHTGNITGVLFSRDGHQLVSSSGGGHDLRVWDLSSGTCTAVLLGHGDDVTCLAISFDGHIIASGSNDLTCRLWDAATGQCTAVLRGHTSAVTGVAFSPPERGKPQRLVTSSSDNTMRIWAPVPGFPGTARTRGLKVGISASGGAAEMSSPTFGRDQRHSNSALDLDLAMGLTVRSSPVEAAPHGADGGGGADGISGGSHTCVQVLHGREGGLQGVAWAPDGRRLVGAHGADVCLWDLQSGKVAATLKGHSANVLAVAFSPNDGGRRLASSGWDKVIRLWDTRTNKCVATATGHTDLVRAISWSPDCRRLASASSDNTLRIWDVSPLLAVPANTANATTVIAVDCTALLRQSEWLTAVSFSPDGRSLASGSVAKELRMWDVEACEAEFSAACTSGAATTTATTLQVMPSPRLKAIAAAAGGGDGGGGSALGTLHKMTRKSLKILKSSEAESTAAAAGAAGAADVAHTGDVTCVALSPDGALLATASQDKTVRLYDSSSASWLATLSGHDGCVTCVAWAPPPSSSLPARTAKPLQLASVCHDLTVRIWDLDLGDGTQPIQAICSKTMHGHTDRIRSVAWSPAADGRLATGAEDNHVRLWDSSKGVCIATLWGHGNYVTCVSYCPADGGRTVTSASQDSTIRVWDTAKGQAIRTLQGHDHYVNYVTYTPCGSLLASAACDHTIRLWEHSSGKCIAVLTGHTHFVNYVAFEPSAPWRRKASGGDGTTTAAAALPRRLASASTDETVRVWDLKSRKCGSVLQGHSGPVHCVTWLRPPAASVTTAITSAATTAEGGKGGKGGSTGRGGGAPQRRNSLPLELASGAADHSVRFWREGYGTEG